MIPPVVQPGDQFQRVRMPDVAGVVSEALRVASVTGNLVQLEWSDLLSAAAWSSIFARTTDPGVRGEPWNDNGHLVFSVGTVGGFMLRAPNGIDRILQPDGVSTFLIP